LLECLVFICDLIIDSFDNNEALCVVFDLLFQIFFELPSLLFLLHVKQLKLTHSFLVFLFHAIDLISMVLNRFFFFLLKGGCKAIDSLIFGSQPLFAFGFDLFVQ